MIDESVGVDDTSRVRGDPQARYANIRRLHIHRHLRDDGRAALSVLVPRESQAAIARQATARLEHRVQDRQGTCVVTEMATPEVCGIGTGREREFVHERLDGEHVALGSQATQRGCPHRGVRDEVLGHLLVRKRIDRQGVAVNAHFGTQRRSCRRRLERFGQQASREQVHTLCAGRWTGNVGEAVDVVRPRGDTTRFVQRGAHRHVHRRSQGLEAVLVFPRPFQQDTVARRGSGDEHRIQRGIVGTVVAVASRAGDVANLDTSRVDAQHASDDVP